MNTIRIIVIFLQFVSLYIHIYVYYYVCICVCVDYLALFVIVLLLHTLQIATIDTITDKIFLYNRQSIYI